MASLSYKELSNTIIRDECLHCRLMALVQLHYAQYGERQGDVRLISVQDALRAMAQVAGELLAVHPDAKHREKFTVELDRDVRDSIEAAIKDGVGHHDIAWPQ